MNQELGCLLTKIYEEIYLLSHEKHQAYRFSSIQEPVGLLSDIFQLLCRNENYIRCEVCYSLEREVDFYLGRGSRFGRSIQFNSRISVVSSCTGTQRNETLTNCITTPCMDVKTIGIPLCTGTPGQPQNFFISFVMELWDCCDLLCFMH